MVLSERHLVGARRTTRLELCPRPPQAGGAISRRTAARRRGVLGALAGLLIIGVVVASGPGGSAVASRPGTPRSVIVRPRETPWDLAGRYAPAGMDPRAYVDGLIRLNHLDGPLQAGQRLRLPR